jgi:hypothetical protein
LALFAFLGLTKGFILLRTPTPKWVGIVSDTNPVGIILILGPDLLKYKHHTNKITKGPICIVSQAVKKSKLASK